MINISLEYALKIGNILVDIGGANSKILDLNSEFIRYLTKEESNWGHEYRFMGHLGSGGKFYSSWDNWRVSCYQESETPFRLSVIKEINEQLKKLHAEYYKKLEKNQCV